MMGDSCERAKESGIPDEKRAASAEDWLGTAQLRRYVEELARRGIDADRLLAVWCKDPVVIADPELPVPRKEALRLLHILATQTPPDFGLQLGFQHSVSKVSLFGYTLQVCRTYGEYIDRWQGHLIYSGYLLTIRSVVDDGGWRVELDPPEGISDQAFAMCASEIFAGFYPTFKELTGTQFYPTRLEMKPGSTAIMRSLKEVLGAEVVASDRTSIVMPYAYRGLPICFPEKVRVAYGQRTLDRLGATVPTEEPLIVALCRSFLHSASRTPTLGSTARALNLSKRTLNRSLERIGWTFQDAVACYRRGVVIALLKTNEVTIKDIAASIGYADTNSLRRAFREWTGMSIVEWSKAYAGAAPPRNSKLLPRPDRDLST